MSANTGIVTHGGATHEVGQYYDSVIDKINQHIEALGKEAILKANSPLWTDRASGNIDYTLYTLAHFVLPPSILLESQCLAEFL